MAQKLIAVIGSARKISPQTQKLAFEVGKLIAQKGAVLLCGGKEGVMAAAAKGAKKAGGLVVGILPEEDRSKANPYLDIALATGIGLARNCIIARAADALIALPGKYGTLSEIAYALQFGKPVIVLSPSYPPAERHGLQTWEIEGIIKAKTPRKAVKEAWERIG